MAVALKRVHQIAQHADDLDRAVAFYRDTLGLSLIARFDPPGLAFFDLGNTRLLLEAAAASVVVYYEVDDIDTSYRSLLAAGVVFIAEPHRIHRDDAGDFGPPGNEEWMAFFRDSEQNVLALVERRAPA
jgi:methylmalonyl-CoA/ethylmalonyl-CoA epimerase